MRHTYFDTRVQPFETETGLPKFHFNDQVIEASTWASIQEALEVEILDIWLKKEVPKIQVQDAHQQVSQSQPVLPSSNPDRKYAPLDPVPVVLPFLVWPIVDDDDQEIKTYLPDERASRFLYAICRDLPAKCATGVAEKGSSTTGSSDQAEIIIEGKNYRDLVLQYREASLLFYTTIIMQARMLLRKFRVEHDESTEDQSSPIRLFWGALYEILAGHAEPNHRSDPSRLRWLAETLSRINILAERIHLGVHYRNAVSSDSGALQDAIGTYVVLLDSLVDALKAVFHMLIETVRLIRLGRTVMDLEKGTKDFADQACKLLTQARDQLIIEANRVLPNGQVDLVASPEVILVTLMERLIRGVFGDGIVDVIGIYGAVMEHLVTTKPRNSQSGH